MEMVFQYPSKHIDHMLMMLLRLILTEGIFTVLLGIFTYFFLPDCKSS